MTRRREISAHKNSTQSRLRSIFTEPFLPDRRRHVIAGYIVDFYCAELWLAVVEGAVHQGRRVDDRERDDHLASLGVRVVRLLNADVLDRLHAVVEQLARCCERIAQWPRLLSRPPPPRARYGI